MSMTIAPRSDARPAPADFRGYSGKVWRLVEAQHRISTNRLAGNSDDQALLEALVEEVKPVMPSAARGLHYLLATPFRYGHARPSRFRRANVRPGIFYAAEHIATALAETAYWRLRFFSRARGFTPPRSVVEHSAFTIPIGVDRALDLTAPPFDANAAHWTDPDDYGACQDFADSARAIGAQAILYASVRDAAHRLNVAVFDPAAFAAPAPRIEQTWHLRYEDGQITAFAAFPSNVRLAFTFDQFGLTPP